MRRPNPNRHMHTTITSQPVLIGNSPAVSELRDCVARIARADAKVLITGESGSGKELVAQTLHASGARADESFVAVNCAGLSDGLLESELFGHVKGSFTGAYRDKPGKFQQADGGSILLDEVGEMSLRMQGLLLRFLQTGEIQRIGADLAPSRVDVRVIAATNRDLRVMSAEGKFRQDLFYRLNVIHIAVPPLRERREDIPPLAHHLLERFAAHDTCVVRSVSDEAMHMLTAYHWPGNVRELQNVVERLALTVTDRSVLPEHLPPDIRRPVAQERQPIRERRRTVADDLFRRMIEDRQSFWTAVYPLYLQRDITRGNIRDLVRKGLEESRGNYKIVARLFNLEQREYKRFLNFLRKNDCQLPFRDYR
jgi:transcriptional regulator with GAF, ATPase, and Fis domain